MIIATWRGKEEGRGKREEGEQDVI